MVTFVENIFIPTSAKYTLLSYISWLQILFGALMLTIWLKEIFKQTKKVKKIPLSWKNEKGEWMWFHILAELTTAFLLIVSGILFQLAVPKAVCLTLFSAGLLFYASLNGLSWVIAQKSRYIFVIPMSVGIILSTLILKVLI